MFAVAFFLFGFCVNPAFAFWGLRKVLSWRCGEPSRVTNIMVRCGKYSSIPQHDIGNYLGPHFILPFWGSAGALTSQEHSNAHLLKEYSELPRSTLFKSIQTRVRHKLDKKHGLGGKDFCNVFIGEDVDRVSCMPPLIQSCPCRHPDFLQSTSCTIGFAPLS